MTGIRFAETTAAAAAELRTRLRGDVLVAGDAAFADARQVWNGAVDRWPAVIARCADEQDVATAVGTARDHGLPLSVRGGGHDWAGRAVCDGGVVIDLRRMRAVHVDPDAALATAEGGALACDVAAAAHPHGYAPVTGAVRAVGIAGLTMGGGYGLLAGAHGLALDNLVSARLVLANGRIVTASQYERADLFWALRGGGGNFGVLTSARYRLHPIRRLLAGLLLFPLDQAPDVLRGYRDVLAGAPDELTVMSGFCSGANGVPMLFLVPAWCGDLATGERTLAMVRRIGTPVIDQVDAMPCQDVIGLFDDNLVPGRHNVMRTCWLPYLSGDAVNTLVQAARAITSPLSGVFLHHFHGAAARVPVTDTAFALRRDHLMVEIIGTWRSDEDGARHRRWADDLAAALAPHALPGGYANLLDAGECGRALLGYGRNAARLLATKRRYDPDHVFSAVPTLPA
jgi:FAD/FMN-containing dehydrogenase